MIGHDSAQWTEQAAVAHNFELLASAPGSRAAVSRCMSSSMLVCTLARSLSAAISAADNDCAAPVLFSRFAAPLLDSWPSRQIVACPEGLSRATSTMVLGGKSACCCRYCWMCRLRNVLRASS